MKKTVLLALVFLCSSLLLSSVALADPLPQVVVSIKPIHSLVAGVMQGVGEPQLLVKGGGSPHGYVLRPSEAQALADADLIVWVGHQLESFLEKPLATIGKKARQLELSELLEPFLLPVRQGGSWETHKHQEPQHQHGQVLNQHLWLSPLLAKRIVAQVAAALIDIDPVHQSNYQENSLQLQQRLDQLHVDLSEKLTPVKDIPYVVFHDAYQYFEVAYGLNAVGSITIDPERRPGARRIIEMRQKIKDLTARCVFSEPQFEPRLVSTIIEGSGARTGELDPIGAELVAGPDNYFQLMNALADDLLAGFK